MSTRDSDRWHDALGAEAEALRVGPSPVAAVMRDGRALRFRRRAALGTGLAALAVLPVAVVAGFGSGASGRAVTAGAMTPTGQMTTTKSPDGPWRPSATDTVVPLAKGTEQGVAWAFTLRRYAIHDTGARGDIVMDGSLHLPLSLAGRPGNTSCEDMYLSLSTELNGTPLPSGGSCGGGTRQGSVDGKVDYYTGFKVMLLPGGPRDTLLFLGNVDPTKAASVTVTWDSGSQVIPFYRRSDDPLAFYLGWVHIPGLSSSNLHDHKVTAVFSNAAGHEVYSESLSSVDNDASNLR